MGLIATITESELTDGSMIYGVRLQEFERETILDCTTEGEAQKLLEAIERLALNVEVR